MSNEQYKCPYCGNNSILTDETSKVIEVDYLLADDLQEKKLILVWQKVCAFSECRKSSFMVIGFHSALYRHKPNGHRSYDSYGESFFRFNFPDSVPASFPDFVPRVIKDDYIESFNIKSLSPKASATLARRCLQGMIRDFWGVTGKPNLAKEIEAIKEKVEPITWDAIDAVRQIGNIGAHMEKDINVIIDVDEGEADLLLRLIEDLIKDWYVAREERKKRTQTLIEVAKIKKSRPTLTTGEDTP